MPGGKGRWVYRVSLLGKADCIAVLQNFFLLAGPDGDQVVIDGTDNLDFALSGVPNLVALQDATNYLPDYHAESDTYDKVNAKEAKRNEAIASVLIYGIAEAEGRPAKRQSRAEVEKLVIDTKLDEQLKVFGQWDDYKSGKRGFAK